jgi:large subunit ribosomal protein L4
MPTLNVVNLKNEKIGTINLNASVFDATVNVPLVHQVLKAQQAGWRQGTAKTKTKSEVRGGGRKPFRQKGTGNARQGSSRSPLNPGGGQSFGPVPRSYEQATPKEMMRGALRSALSDRVKSNRMIVVDQFDLASVKTKVLSEILSKQFQVDKVLLIDDVNRNLELSARNIPNVRSLRVEAVNVYDIVKAEWVIFSKKAVQNVEARLAVGE